jgi:hypothetical protein
LEPTHESNNGTSFSLNLDPKLEFQKIIIEKKGRFFKLASGFSKKVDKFNFKVKINFYQLLTILPI